MTCKAKSRRVLLAPSGTIQSGNVYNPSIAHHNPKRNTIDYDALLLELLEQRARVDLSLERLEAGR